jgi:anti-sigma regulatory factor (Ser/Thr protein kinase)
MNTDDLLTLETVAADGRNAAARLAHTAGVSRQVASARLARAVRAGWLERTGQGAGVRYTLKPLMEVDQSFVREGLSEDRVWREWLAPLVADLPTHVKDIWHYGLTEMVNNAIDHSGSDTVRLTMCRSALWTRAEVRDGGLGIFERIRQALDLFDPREAILELAKGKFTTDPANHSGEGIFFSSKMFDAFEIRSGGLHFMHSGDGLPDVLSEQTPRLAGTSIAMQLDNRSQRRMRDVFDQFAAPEEFTFAKTVVPVRLAQHEGEKLMSRSQAKRLTMRFERFQTVVLDFSGVEDIGQGFADEVFRVFQQAHPETHMVPIHMTDDVRRMVGRMLARPT